MPRACLTKTPRYVKRLKKMFVGSYYVLNTTRVLPSHLKVLLNGVPGVNWDQVVGRMIASGSDVGVQLAGIRVSAAVGHNAAALLVTLISVMTLLIECANGSAEAFHQPFQLALEDTWRLVQARPAPALQIALEKLVGRLRTEGAGKLRCRLPS